MGEWTQWQGKGEAKNSNKETYESLSTKYYLLAPVAAAQGSLSSSRKGASRNTVSGILLLTPSLLQTHFII